MAIANITGNILTDSGVSTSSLVSGSGTTNYHAKFTGTSTLGNSLIFDNGTNVGIGTASPFAIADTNLTVNGTTSSAIQLGFNGTRYGQFYTDSGEIRLSAVANLPLTFYSNNLERMRITSTGQVGIGITPTGSWGLQMYGNGSANTVARIQLQNSSTGSADSDGGGISMEGIDFVTRNNESTGVVKWELGGTERMRITSGGTVQIGTASTNNIAITGGISGNTPGILLNSGTSANGVGDSGNIQIFDRTNSRSWVIQMDASYQLRTFYYNGSTWATNGYQTTGGTWTNSDERRKENITLLEYGLNEVLQLTPKRFTYKIDEFKKPYMGFIAQEVLPIMPEAVQSYLESSNEEEIEYYAMNYDNLVPVLVKAIQELSAKVEALENKA